MFYFKITKKRLIMNKLKNNFSLQQLIIEIPEERYYENLDFKARTDLACAVWNNFLDIFKSKKLIDNNIIEELRYLIESYFESLIENKEIYEVWDEEGYF